MKAECTLVKPTRETTDEIKAHAGSTLRIPDGARILIVCAADSVTERLETIFQEAGFISERAKDITTGCELAKSGQFQVVVSQLLLSDGSWRRLIEVARHYELGFEVVLLAGTFDLMEWTEALNDGAFDVLDCLCDLPKATEAAKCAVWAAYLKGAGPRPEAAKPSKAA